MKPLVLDTTSKSITALLSGAPATTNPDFTSHWGDATSTTFTEGATDGTFNGTTPVTLVAAPAASTRRIINQIVITNVDTAAVTITIRYLNGASTRRLWFGTLQPDETMTLDGSFDENGALKTAIATIPDHTHTGTGSGGQLDASAVFNAGAVTSEFGGTGQDFSASTGIIQVSAGTFSAATAPAFTDFTNANHDHLDTDDGGLLPVGAMALRGIVNGRLTLTTALPVTTANVTAATNVYFTPYRGSQVALYDGSAAWKLYNFSEITIAVPATTDTNYDVFVYDSGGSVVAEAVAWTNATTRATALATQDGVLVKTGTTARRYAGSFRTTTVSGQTEDSLTKRYVWNYYNRLRRKLLVLDTTDTWSVTSTSFESLNGSTANRVEFLVGWLEDPIRLEHLVSINGVAGQFGINGIGLDSTTVNSADVSNFTGGVASARAGALAIYDGFPSAVGYHFLQLLQRVTGGTFTYYGDNGDATSYKTGGLGWIHG